MHHAIPMAMLCKDNFNATLLNTSTCMQKGPCERDLRVEVSPGLECVTEMEQQYVMGLELAMACGTSV